MHHDYELGNLALMLPHLDRVVAGLAAKAGEPAPVQPDHARMAALPAGDSPFDASDRVRKNPGLTTWPRWCQVGY